MASRTQIVCLHEGQRGRSIDPIFINRLLKSLGPRWLKPWKGNNVIRPVDCGGRVSLIKAMPAQLNVCLEYGSDTTLMVWADLDDDMADGNQLKDEFWKEAQAAGITADQFDQVVFAFAKDRLENWIEFLRNGATDESQEGPRVTHSSEAANAARVLAERCQRQTKAPPLPPSLAWSCENWNKLVKRMQH
jgi:hypothetical protein